MHSEQLGSIYGGMCVKTVVMFAKSISILLVWVMMVVLCVLFSLFMPLGETLNWLPKIKGKKRCCLDYISAVYMYAYIWYRGSVHMCIQESLSLSADSEITGDCKVIWSFFHPDKPPAKPGFSPSV